jgi:hypothetical protein
VSETRIWTLGIGLATLALILLWAGVFLGAGILSLLAGAVWWWGRMGGSRWPSLMMLGAAIVAFAKVFRLSGFEAIGFGLGMLSLLLTVGNGRQQKTGGGKD